MRQTPQIVQIICPPAEALKYKPLIFLLLKAWMTSKNY